MVNPLQAQGTDAIAALRAALGRTPPDAIALLAPPPIDELPPELRERLRDITIPILALFPTDAAPHATAWRRAFPTCFITFVYAATPDLSDRRPAITDLISDFFARRDNFLVRTETDRLHD